MRGVPNWLFRCRGGAGRFRLVKRTYATILPPLFVVTLFLPLVAVAETSPPDSNQLLRDYQAAELRYQEVAKIYRALRREVRSDPVLKEKVFGSSRPTTGLRLGPVPNDGKGVWVRRVVAGSLAEQAGLRAGDVVLAVDGERLDDLSGARAVQTMTRAIGGADAGASLRIEYLRDGEITYLYLCWPLRPSPWQTRLKRPSRYCSRTSIFLTAPTTNSTKE